MAAISLVFEVFVGDVLLAEDDAVGDEGIETGRPHDLLHPSQHDVLVV